MTYRTYAEILIGAAALVATCLLAVAVWLQPLSGDLTRLGGYPENQFGWTGEQVEFDPPLAQPDLSKQKFDVLVIGDSFSLRTDPDRQTRAGGYWTDHLAFSSGASVGVVWEVKLPVGQYLASASFRDYPPRFLVIEMVERGLYNIPAPVAPGCPSAPALAASPWQLHPATIPPRSIQRSTAHRISAVAIDVANDYIRKGGRRMLGLDDRTKVRRMALQNSDMFTNLRADEILVYTDDFNKAEWAETDYQRIVCTMRSWQAAAEANGVTRVLILIAPDKSTIYRRRLRDPFVLPEVISRIATQVGPAVLRADIVLIDAVAAGQKDVYLPNDTHWGSAGARIAAGLVADQMSGDPTPPKSVHP